MLITADGRLHPCCDKAQLIHKLESQIKDDPGLDQSTHTHDLVIPDDTCLVFDGMAVVNEQSCVQRCYQEL